MNSGRPRYDHELLGSSFAHNAELAHVPPTAGPRNIVTPCHGVPLSIDYRYVGSHSEVDTIYCGHDGCLNAWNEDGTVYFWQEPQ